MRNWFRNAVFVLFIAGAPSVNAEDGVFDSKGVKIRYVTEGTGDPVVFIHGWMGDSSTWGRDKSGNTKLNAADAKGFQLIALDCRGHGKSDKPHEQEKYGAEMAEDVVRLLEHLKIKKAHLVGYSMGSFVAGKVAASHPDRVLSVVYGGQAPLVKGLVSKEESVDEVGIFAKAVEEGKGFAAYFNAVSPPGKPKPTEEQAKLYAALMFGGKDVKAFAAAGLSFKNLAVTEDELKRCKAPVLFVHGSEEWANTKDRVAAIRKMLDRSELKVINGASHVSTLSRPEFGRAIREFIVANKQK